MSLANVTIYSDGTRDGTKVVVGDGTVLDCVTRIEILPISVKSSPLVRAVVTLLGVNLNIKTRLSTRVEERKEEEDVSHS